jgi:isocitrate/isopropylmalate dehydrogenase
LSGSAKRSTTSSRTSQPRYRVAAIASDEVGAGLADAALRVLGAAGLAADVVRIAAPRAGGAHGALGSGDGGPGPRLADADFAAAAAADGVLLAADPRGGHALSPADLDRLLSAIAPSVRFLPCRAYAGSPWNRAEGIDLFVFGDGAEGAADRASRQALLETAWGFARRHGRRRVTLVASRMSAVDLPALDAAAELLASEHEEIELARVDAADDLLAAFGAPRAHDIVVALADAWGPAAAAAAHLAGGAGFVPAVRFGAEAAIVEIGGAPAGHLARGAARPERGPDPPPDMPIAAAVAARVLCEWLGEGGKAARIERAIAAAVRDELPRLRARLAATGSAGPLVDALTEGLTTTPR